MGQRLGVGAVQNWTNATFNLSGYHSRTGTCPNPSKIPTLTHLLPGNNNKLPADSDWSRTFVAFIHLPLHNNMKKQICLYLLLLIPILAAAQHLKDYLIYADDDCKGDTCEAVVLALSGLKMRAQPDFRSKTMVVVPFGKKIRYVFDLEQSEDYQVPYDVDSVAGKWCRIFWQGKSGYAFSGYLGKGIFRMDKPFYLFEENAATCGDNAFISPNYHYYGVFPNGDTSAFTIKKHQPLFFNMQVGFIGGANFSFRQKQLSYFAFATVEPFKEGVVSVSKSKQTLYVDWHQPATATPKISIPNTTWEIMVKFETVKNENGLEYSRPRLQIRDKKTGSWHYLFDGDVNFYYVALDWSGDFDGDGIQDFMLSTKSGLSGSRMLFGSKNTGKWQFVKMIGVYFWGDCC